MQWRNLHMGARKSYVTRGFIPGFIPRRSYAPEEVTLWNELYPGRSFKEGEVTSGSSYTSVELCKYLGSITFGKATHCNELHPRESYTLHLKKVIYLGAATCGMTYTVGSYTPKGVIQQEWLCYIWESFSLKEDTPWVNYTLGGVKVTLWEELWSGLQIRGRSYT